MPTQAPDFFAKKNDYVRNNNCSIAKLIARSQQGWSDGNITNLPWEISVVVIWFIE